MYSRNLVWVTILFPQKINVGDYFSLICVNFVPELIFSVLVGSLHGDLGEDPRFWTNNNSTLTRKLVWSTLIILMLIFYSHYEDYLV